MNKIYELTLRLNSCLRAKSEEDAKKEMINWIREEIKEDKFSWRIKLIKANKELLILKHLLALNIQELEGTTGVITELKRLLCSSWRNDKRLKKINSQSNLTKEYLITIGFALLVFHKEHTYPKDKKAIGKQIKHIMKILDPVSTYLLEDEKCST